MRPWSCGLPGAAAIGHDRPEARDQGRDLVRDLLAHALPVLAYRRIALYRHLPADPQEQVLARWPPVLAMTLGPHVLRSPDPSRYDRGPRQQREPRGAGL